MFGTVLTILSVLFNFWTLALFLGLLAAAALIYFIPPPWGGPVKLLSLVLNPGVWMGIAAALAFIYIGNSTKVIQQQKQEIHQSVVQTKTATDGTAVLTDNATQKQEAAKVSTRLRHAIDTAKPGDEEDALLDQIATEQCSDPANSTRADCLHK